MRVFKVDFDEFLVKLRELGYSPVLPKKNSLGDWHPEVCEGSCPFPEEFENYFFPWLKDLVFPQESVLFEFDGTQFHERVDEIPPLAFFARPCDVTALRYTDRFYLGKEFYDPVYEARRKNLLIVSVVCRSRCEAGFCDAVGGGPWARAGFDVQLWRRGDAWLAEAGSELGLRALEGFPEARAEEIAEIKREIEAEFARTRRFAEVRPYRPDPELYRKLGLRCFRCGGCVYLCPTGTCYTETPREETLYRHWDACLLEGYHRMAKGASLRPTQAERMAFRFECKLRVGACTGCGRCSRTCIGHAAMEAYLEETAGEA